MKRSKPKTRWLLVSILIIASALTYFGYRYFTTPTAQPADIFMITSDLEFGNTTIEGTLRKDAPAGTKGEFVIVLDDMQPIILDVVGIDNLLGQKVTAKGYLYPPDGEQSMTMVVSSIETTSP